MRPHFQDPVHYSAGLGVVVKVQIILKKGISGPDKRSIHRDGILVVLFTQFQLAYLRQEVSGGCENGGMRTHACACNEAFYHLSGDNSGEIKP